MIGRMLSAGLDTNPIIVDYSYDMPKYLKEQYLGMFVKYTGNNTDEYKNGYTYQVSQKQSGTDTVYFFAPYFYLESLASSADTSKIIDGYQAYNDNGKKIVGQYKTSEKVITENGTFYPADDSVNAYSKVTVNVAGADPGVGTGDFWVKVIDYDGTVLLEKRGNNGDSFDLPSAPSHEGLVFQEWSASCPITDGKVVIDNNNIMAGAVYTTASGQNEFDITLTKVTGLAVTLNMDGTKDWGDGTSDTNTTHTYTAYGDYTIKCDGTTMDVSSDNGLFGQSLGTADYSCIKAKLNNVQIIDYAFLECRSLSFVILPHGVVSIYQCFENCSSLKSVVLPNGITNLGNYTLDACHSMHSLVVPSSVQRWGNAFSNCYALKEIVVPKGISGAVYLDACYGLNSIYIPQGVTTVGFGLCRSLKNIFLPQSVNNIARGAFSQNYSLATINLPDGIRNITAEAFNACYLPKIVIPPEVKSVQANAFSSSAIIKYDFSQCTAVPTLSNKNAFSGINKIAKIIVPDSLYDEWIAAANWSTYADYIYKASEVTA